LDLILFISLNPAARFQKIWLFLVSIDALCRIYRRQLSLKTMTELSDQFKILKGKKRGQLSSVRECNVFRTNHIAKLHGKGGEKRD